MEGQEEHRGASSHINFAQTLRATLNRSMGLREEGEDDAAGRRERRGREGGGEGGGRRKTGEKGQTNQFHLVLILREENFFLLNPQNTGREKRNSSDAPAGSAELAARSERKQAEQTRSRRDRRRESAGRR
eukprot:763478-Hanusia_phi.AAC.2